MLRKIASVIFFLLIFVFGAVFIYDELYFLPHRVAMRKILEQSDYEDKYPPKTVRQLIDASYKNGGSLSSSVARLLMYRYRGDENQDRVLISNVKMILWRVLISLNFQSDDLYSYYCILSFNGSGYGASELSKRLYSKPLSALSAEEAATVIAILWYPSQSQSNSERVIGYRDKLLNRLSSK